jgi:hypothetical protein
MLAGLKEVVITSMEIPTSFASFEDYWGPFLGGQGPAPAYAVSLDETAREHMRNRIRERIATQLDATNNLIARAWAVHAIVAKQTESRACRNYLQTNKVGNFVSKREMSSKRQCLPLRISPAYPEESGTQRLSNLSRIARTALRG